MITTTCLTGRETLASPQSMPCQKLRHYLCAWLRANEENLCKPNRSISVIWPWLQPRFFCLRLVTLKRRANT